MRVDSLRLRNFRGFEDLEISFDPAITLLLGENMAGKSAVLDGLAVALGALFLGLDEGPARPILDDEVRREVVDIAGVPDLQPRFPVDVTVRATSSEILCGALEWTRTRREDGMHDEQIHKMARVGLRAALDRPAHQPVTNLPVVASYGVRRTGRAEVLPDLARVGSRRDGYADCLDIVSTYRTLAAWMRKQTQVQLQRNQPSAQLAAVETAVRRCLGGLVAAGDVDRFWFDLQYEELRLQVAGGRIHSFGMLSEGCRNMVAMVADLARRAAVLNPQLEERAAAGTSGIVMIDELELHLHPAWQRRVVEDLRATFPRMQFVVTTHSPQVVASASRDQVRILRQNALERSGEYVQGRDSNQILQDVFAVPPRPLQAQQEIDRFFEVLEDGDLDRARSLLASLEARLGSDDATIVRARWILDAESADPGPVDPLAFTP